MKKNHRNVFVTSRGAAMRLYKDEPDNARGEAWAGTSDFRLNPFSPPRPASISTMCIGTNDTIDTIEVKTDKVYAPQVFFDEVLYRLTSNKSNEHMGAIRFLMSPAMIRPEIHPILNKGLLNSWLAIIDNFGLEESYDKQFLEMAGGIEDYITLHAFLEDESDISSDRIVGGKRYNLYEYTQALTKMFFPDADPLL